MTAPNGADMRMGIFLNMGEVKYSIIDIKSPREIMIFCLTFLMKKIRLKKLLH